MISPEQLATALEHLDPRDRELLALSLRRRVPDEALGRLFDCQPAEIARRRAGAIERLADDLGVQRGEDLGAVLKALLEPETWAVVEGGSPRPAGAEFDPEARRSSSPKEEAPPELEPRVYRLGDPPPAGDAVAANGGSDTPVTAPAAREAAPAVLPDPLAPSAEANPAPATPVAAEAEAEAVLRPASIAAAKAVEQPAQGAERPRPVLEMLADEQPAHADVPRRAPRTMVVAGLAIAAFAALAGFVGAQVLGGDGGATQGAGGDGTRHFQPQERGPLGAVPFPSDPQSASCYPTAYVRRKTVLYREPGGRKLITIAARTEWNSPRVLGVSSQREGWLAVTVPELPNGEVGWIERSQARVDCVRWSLHVDLSRRRLYVRKDGHTVRTLTVAIGSRAHPTPEGRFAVTDRLRVTDKNSPYGCCVLALSGHQTKLPDDWPGGDRLAVHATTDLGSIGKPVSLGCMRSTSSQVRWLIETVPLGAPIFIRA